MNKSQLPKELRIFRIHPDSNRVLGIITPVYNEKSCWQAECHAHPKNQKVLGVLDVSISLADVDKTIIQKRMGNCDLCNHCCNCPGIIDRFFC